MKHGAGFDPPNRFEKQQRVDDWEHWEGDHEFQASRHARPIEYSVDASRTLVSRNDSPDIPFTYSLNPYRGCVHGCAYCYARPTHEYLGFKAGIEFETKIVIKPQAAMLFREFLSRPDWACECVVFSGVTDCYQPGEREFRLTRACLEVALEFGQPVSIITKNALVLRDLDLLQALNQRHLVNVNISLTTLDPELASVMEPRTSIPAARLRAIQALASAGIPVRVMTAPLIPGLNDHELPSLMKAARQAGASDARYVMLRLPLSVKPVFLEWLDREIPMKAEKVKALQRHVRGGEFNVSTFGKRMKGEGEIADQISRVYHVFYQRLGFTNLPTLSTNVFRVPGRTVQKTLF